MSHIQKLPNTIFCSILCLFYAIMPDSNVLIKDDISDNKPVAYFADAVAYSELDMISLEFDVNLLQEIVSNVRVNAWLIDSNGQLADSQTFIYSTFSDNIDYQRMDFIPTFEDAYSIVITVYPENGLAADSFIINILWPPGTGAHFRDCEPYIFDNQVELSFDIDLEYNISYIVAVEAILYNSDNDVVAYNCDSYMINGSSSDERKIIFALKESSIKGYYAELIVYVEGYPASHIFAMI